MVEFNPIDMYLHCIETAPIFLKLFFIVGGDQVRPDGWEVGVGVITGDPP